MFKPIAAAAICALVAAAQPALAAFVGPTAPSNFTVTNTGTLIGPGEMPGTASFTLNQLVLTGPNGISPGPTFDVPACVGGVYGEIGPCELQVMVQLNGAYTFDFVYTTLDPDGPTGDIFGVFVDGQRIQLSDPGLDVVQTGRASYTVSSSFGFFINCTDCVEGPAVVTVSDFSFVPEPSSTSLLLAGMLGCGVLGLRRRETANG